MRLSLRLKLTLVSLLLLFIPFIGFRFSELIKQDLLASRKETMSFSARAVASALSGRTGLFDREIFHSLNPSRDLYLYQLSSPMRINGKIDDWLPHLSEARNYGGEQLLFSSKPYSYDSLHFQHMIGVRGKFLYALFLVTDDKVIYRNPGSLRLDLSDHLQIGIEDQHGTLHQYLLSTIVPGWINGFLMSTDKNNPIPKRVEPRIQGVWAESDDGYILEIRIPMDMIGQKLAFAIADVDNPAERKITALVGTAATEDAKKLGWLLSPSDAIESILASFSRPQSRILIVDSNRRIRASFGSLNEDIASMAEDTSLLGKVSAATYNIFAPIYRFFIQPFATDFSETTVQPSTLNIQGIKEALHGASTVTSYTTDKGHVEIMAAIAPLRQNDTILGAVVVEQTTHSILTLQNKVIEESLTVTILAFIFGGLGLILFASRVSSRIRRLSSQAASAIGSSGQIQTTISPTKAKDEIGDLSRTLTSMLDQLHLQISYRDKMADNLEHEMRTPLAGISASLKNMIKEMDNPPDHVRKYLDWALVDITRLENLLTTIRDATNLQEALVLDMKENFELDTAIGMWLDHSWRQAFPKTDFIYTKPDNTITLYGDPTRIRQMLDKLIDNAISFHTPGTPVEISLAVKQQKIYLNISNLGPIIPKELHNQIFNSMVSYRQRKDPHPHLGLGLYIVRTIVEHHQGNISINSIADNRGTTFSLILPTASSV
jgi:two-component system sensor histidine kinase ChvG